MKPCPFCAGVDNAVGQWLAEWQVICRCGAMGPAATTKEQATKLWDQRKWTGWYDTNDHMSKYTDA